jgi:hypothetical protein
MLNVEGMLISQLGKALGVPVSASVPASPPGDFVTVERTGGGDSFSAIHENPTVVVDCYGATRSRARELADKADAAIKALPCEACGVSRVEPNSVLVHYPDVQSGHERYESTYSLTTYEYKQEA